MASAPPLSTRTAPRFTPEPGSQAAATPGFFKRHPVLTYYALTFMISWGGILLIVGGPAGLVGTAAEIERLMPLAIPLMLLGPSIAGLVMTGLVYGKPGYGALFARLLRWPMGARWYAVALLTAPLVLAAVALVLSLSSSAFLPGIVTTTDRTTFLLIGVASGLLVGVFEELGWTGFAIPTLRRRHSVMATGLSLGVVWGAWHLLTNDLWGAGISAGDLPLTWFVVVNGFGLLFGQLAAFRVLMVWVYDRTESLSLAMLMHATLTASTFVVAPAAIAGLNGLIYGFGVAAVMWLLVAAIVVARRARVA